MSQSSQPVVIAVDGPSGAGKGTIARRVADELGFHFLDSGAVYRAAAINCIGQQLDLDDEERVCAALQRIDLRFEIDGRIFIDGEDITTVLRSEEVADAASRLAVLPNVRKTLLAVQQGYRQSPGLVADGRDMGTVVFPDATVKIFMTASARVRAERRLKQLKEHGIEATLAGLVQDIEARDHRDSTRRHAPLAAAPDAKHVDTSALGIDAAVELVLGHVRPILDKSLAARDSSLVSPC